MGSSDGGGADASSRYSKCVENFWKSGLFRIGKPPLPPGLKASSASASQSKECWIDAATLGLFHNVGEGTNNGSVGGHKIFSDLYSRYTGSVPTAAASSDGAVGGLTGMTDAIIPSSLAHPWESLGTSFGMGQDHSLMSNWSSWMERMVSEYIMAITVGCVLGAAVATGASVGLLAASGMLRATNEYVPVFYRWITNKSSPTPTSDDARTTTTTSIQSQSKDATTNVSVLSTRSSGASSLLLLKATGSQSSKQCLDDISILLSKNGATWNTVRQLSVYLVASGGVDASHFREALKGYPLDASTCIISIRFVQRLETEDTVVEVEAMVAVP